MSVLREIAAERERQDEQWGKFHDEHHTPGEWLALLREREFKIGTAVKRDDYADLRKQLVIMAALSVAAVESMDRKAVAVTFHPTHSG